jgi:aminopeptidase
VLLLTTYYLILKIVPNKETLKKYADVLIKFALGSGNGVKKGEVVVLQIPECAKPMIEPLEQSVLEAGAHPVVVFVPEGTDRRTLTDRTFYEYASDEQLDFVAKNHLLGRIEDADHICAILGTNNPHALQGIDGGKILRRGSAMKFYMDARNKKEDEGKFTWVLGSFGTEALAKEAQLSLEEYWEQIVKACFLDEEEPIKKWQQIFHDMASTQEKLNSLSIEKVHLEGEDVDLHIKLGADRKWLGGSGRNIPSFELFISPDWRGTNGWIRFNQPLYSYGSLIKGIRLHFENGIVTECSADENEELLKQMVSTENADKIGEFSLTDKRFSRITKFMADTLYDENMGGEFGNTHIAIGMAYHDSYRGGINILKEEDWDRLGFNDSVVHTDIISTTNRTVTATLTDGSEKIIYRDGMFQLD